MYNPRGSGYAHEMSVKLRFALPSKLLSSVFLFNRRNYSAMIFTYTQTPPIFHSSNSSDDEVFTFDGNSVAGR